MSAIIPPFDLGNRNSFQSASITVGNPVKAWAMCAFKVFNSVDYNDTPPFIFRFGASNSGATFRFSQVGTSQRITAAWRTSSANTGRIKGTGLVLDAVNIVFMTFDRDVANDGSFSQGRIRYWINGVEETAWDITGHSWHGGTTVQATVGGDEFPARNRWFELYAAAASVTGILTPEEILAYEVGDDLRSLGNSPGWYTQPEGPAGVAFDRLVDLINGTNAVQNLGAKYPMSSAYSRYGAGITPTLPLPSLTTITAREGTLSVVPTVGAGSLKVISGSQAANPSQASNSQIAAGLNQDGSAATFSASIPVTDTNPIPLVITDLIPDGFSVFSIVHDMDGAGNYSNSIRGQFKAKRLMIRDTLEKNPGEALTATIQLAVFDNFFSGTRLLSVPSLSITDGVLSLNASADLAGTELDIGDTVDVPMKFVDGGVEYSVMPSVTLSDPA